ncbi:MAG: copper resistance protein CopC [Actinobacteria bacterium]|nr:copper resistance protein CopC [Actinomycetota bacterium]
MKKVAVLLISLFIGVLGAGPALATSLISSSPTGGSVLSLAPTAVTITANADLTDGANEMSVTDPTGKRVDDGSVQMQGATLTVGIKPLTATGVYTVNYTIMSVGESPITSSFTFLFNAPSVISEPRPGASDTPITNQSVNRTSDLLVIALLIFACFILVLMSRYAKETFNSNKPTKPRKILKPTKSKKISK